jgi:hypothetical protein
LLFWMKMTTNEEIVSDVTSRFTSRGYYAYGLQVFKIIIVAIITLILHHYLFLFSFLVFFVM